MSDDNRTVKIESWLLECIAIAVFVILCSMYERVKEIRDDYRSVHGIVEKPKP